ncbi:MAG: FAD-dependent oxidoreductase [Nanoarchaeota archaeon]
MPKTKDILILGAGPAGMACAMELYKKNIKATIIEKESQVGGLAKTLKFIEGKEIFRTDIGPHRFFSKNKYLYDFIEDILQENWIKVKRQTRQYIKGKFYDYPIKPLQAFSNIGLFHASRMIGSYLVAALKYRVLRAKISNFEDYIVANFGRVLGEFNMINYTRKIWGRRTDKLHPDWAKQRIKGLNFTSALRSFFKKSKDSPKTLVDYFYYPQYGTGLIYETIASKIKKSGSEIFTNSVPTKLSHDGKKINLVSVDINNKVMKFKPKKIVSSVPITLFLKLLDPAPPKHVIVAAKNLFWRSQVYIFITLNRKKVTDDQWIYFPEEDIPFGRISEMKNFSKDMSPADKTSLFVEYFVNESDETWSKSDEWLFNLTVSHLQKLKFIKKSEVRKYYVLRKKYVYPVYDVNYKKNLNIIKNYLDKFKNLYYIGRPGRFLYTNQDHSLEMGMLVAKSIIDGKKYDLESIGAEKEYFEKGRVGKD